VEEGYDLVIRIAALEDSSLVARKLAPARRVLCAAPGYLERRGQPRRPAELVAHECLLYSHLATHTEWRFVDGAGKAEAVRVRGRLQANSGDALRGIALGGFGIALLPTFLVGDDILAGRLVHLLPEHENPFGGVYALYPRGRHLSPKVRAFVDYLAESFGVCPPWDRPFTRLEPVAAG
jgi:DNA-binding transcriptional LysR family regulator